MFYIDTNIFLELELKDEKWKECRDFFEKVSKNEVEALISSFHVYSVILRIETETELPSRIKKFVNSISKFLGLSIYEPKLNDWLNVIEIMQKENLDFDDSMVVSCMRANKIKKLVSFDQDFDKIREIERIEPKDVR